MTTVLQRYFTSEIVRSVVFVLAAFLALFALFDLMGELKSVGQGGYQLQHAFLYVLMNLPEYIYELIPIAVLIGTIWTLARFASQSEFTIMRVSSMSTALAVWMLLKIGLFFVVLTFLFGEAIAPFANEMAEKMKLSAQGISLSREFRSGVWAKDVLRTHGLNGEIIGSRFLNVGEVRLDNTLRDVRLYEFDRDFRLTTLITAAQARYQSEHTWQLYEVSETRFPASISNPNLNPAINDSATLISTHILPSKVWVSEITPDFLSVLSTNPDRMSAYDLRVYSRHLADNKQHTERFEIAFWKKIVYPFAVLVMMILALPFAYLHVRAGGISLKIFIGIMIGVSFQLLNNLFSHIGLLNTWPPFATAILPSIVFLLLGVGALHWVEKH